MPPTINKSASGTNVARRGLAQPRDRARSFYRQATFEPGEVPVRFPVCNVRSVTLLSAEEMCARDKVIRRQSVARSLT
jgi:hypothetical protein